jgi:GntR family transcriptional regulator
MVKIFNTIIRESKIPFYVQIMDQFYSAKEKGLLKEGSKIDNEYKLCDIFGVNRFTLRQALRELENENFLYKKRGQGTFIGNNIIETSGLQKVIPQYDEFKNRRGLDFDTKILTKKILIPERRIRGILKISDKEKVNYIERLRLFKNGNAYYSIIYIPQKHCKDFINQNLIDTSTFHIMIDIYNLKIVRCKRYLEAIAPKGHRNIVKELKMSENEWFHFLRTILFIEQDTPVAYYEDFFPGTKSRFATDEKL